MLYERGLSIFPDASYLSSGVDSFVYLTKDGMSVLKLYKPYSMSYSDRLRQIELYQEVTNAAGNHLLTNPYSLEIPGFSEDFLVEITAIDEILRFPDHRMVIGKSRFFAGEQLSSSVEEGFDYERMNEKLDTLSAELNKALNVSGISISPSNIKILTDPQPAAVITDLCGALCWLKEGV